jgi:hypothetical protein
MENDVAHFIKERETLLRNLIIDKSLVKNEFSCPTLHSIILLSIGPVFQRRNYYLRIWSLGKLETKSHASLL